jgi:hypothetical protein
MKCNKYKFRNSRKIAMGLFYFLLLIPVAVGNENSSSEAERSEQWERAAVNYEWAAIAQQEAAQAILSESELLRDAVYEDPSEFTRNMLGAAGGESRAAKLEASAGASFARAAKCWKRVSVKSNASTTQSSTHMAEIARQKATIAYKRSAEIYELSAQAYSIAGKPLQQAALSKKAAVMRELLAQRI